MLTEFIKGIGEQKKFLKNITTEIPEGIFAEYVGKVQKNILMLILGVILISKKVVRCFFNNQK